MKPDQKKEKPWSMWTDETSPAFNAFKVYLRLGPRRSKKKVYEYFKKKGQPESLKQLGKWMRKYKWRLRAEAWDAYRDEVEQKEFIKETKRMARRHAKIAQEMQSKIIKKLKEFDPDDLTPDQLARWFEVTTKIERLSANKSTENVRSVVEEKKVKLDLEDLSDDDLEKLEQIVSKVSSNGEEDDEDDE